MGLHGASERAGVGAPAILATITWEGDRYHVVNEVFMVLSIS